ncbi:hypothetical protein ACIQNG_22805 [Streptomyces sp. NPDC091377]|uniref:hypothetical protein n=1 Tax=Streptomyces sp. NPDC091377 TaxID=3365995 RepID=UPI0037FF6341
MTVSLGTRVSGWLIAGAVAVAALAFTEGRDNGTARPDGRGAPVTVEPTDGSAGQTVSPAPFPEPPALLPSPAGSADAAIEERSPEAAPPATDTPAPTLSPTDPAPPRTLPWLPPGPASPDTDRLPDPASGYDTLLDPDRCGEGLESVPAGAVGPEWEVLRGLASACLAVQGRGGDWEAARQARDSTAGRADSCKGRAALAVLEGLLDFHHRHPTGTARPVPVTDAEPACAFGIAAGDTGTGTGEVRPGDRVRIALRGTFFDPGELTSGGQVLVDGVPVPATAEGPHALSLVIPELTDYPRTVSVSVRYGGVEAALKGAFRVVAPEPGGSPSPGPEGPGEEPVTEGAAALAGAGPAEPPPTPVGSTAPTTAPTAAPTAGPSPSDDTPPTGTPSPDTPSPDTPAADTPAAGTPSAGSEAVSAVSTEAETLLRDGTSRSVGMPWPTGLR